MQRLIWKFAQSLQVRPLRPDDYDDDDDDDDDVDVDDDDDYDDDDDDNDDDDDDDDDNDEIVLGIHLKDIFIELIIYFLDEDNRDQWLS